MNGQPIFIPKIYTNILDTEVEIHIKIEAIYVLKNLVIIFNYMALSFGCTYELSIVWPCVDYIFDHYQTYGLYA